MLPTVHILILAAGASSRMRGTDKLLQPVKDRPVLRHLVEVALGTGAPVMVTLPVVAAQRRTALEGLPVQIIEVPDAVLGMSRSLVRAIDACLPQAGPTDGLMVLPADMPGFTMPALAKVIARFREAPATILRGGTVDGQPGHPAVFPRDLWPALQQVTGDEGGRGLLRKHSERVEVIPLPGQMAVLDLDTPEDWAAWRAGGP